MFKAGRAVLAIRGQVEMWVGALCCVSDCPVLLAFNACEPGMLTVV